MTKIITFDTTEMTSSSTIGSKSHKLIELYKKGLEVPKGLALSTDFFSPWVHMIEAHPKWQEISKVIKQDLSASCRELKDFASTFKLDDDSKNMLAAEITKLISEERCEFFAVRSSSPDEDMTMASFAGGYETVLGVKEDDLEDAIRACFISALDERIILYKREHCVDITPLKMAVLVQLQIKADFAGVGFSLNPINNCFDEAVINSNYGLGETVVSGVVEPDTLIIDKIKRKISQTRVGSKNLSLYLNDEGYLETRETQPASELCLNSAQIMEVLDLISEVEKIYDMPVDIEWAIVGTHLYLLQVRPITTYHPLPEEMITEAGEQKRLYANSTLIEQGLTKPLSVLGTNFLDYILSQMGALTEGELTIADSTAFTCGNQYYMNISNAIASGGKKVALAPGSADDKAMLALLDSINLIDYKPKKINPRLKKSQRKLMFSMLPMLLKILKAAKNPEGFMDKFYYGLSDKLKVFNRNFELGLSLDQKAKTLTGHLNYFLMEAAMPTVMSTLLARKGMTKLFGDEINIDDHLIHITMMLPNNKTTEMGALLYKLASYPELKDINDYESFTKAMSSEKLSDAFMNDYQNYKDEFGARCHAEIDVAVVRPREDERLIFKQIKETSLNITEGDVTVFERAKSLRECSYDYLKSLAAQKGKKALKKFEKYYNTIYHFSGFRETGKQYITRSVDLFRQEVLDIGKQWVENHRLHDVNQIFDLTVKDIDQALMDDKLDLMALRDKNTAFIKRLERSHHIVRMIDSRGKIFFPPANKIQDGSLVGATISPGVARGIASVFHHPTEKPLHKGEILVARATDPGWTPLFVNAQAIVLEIGGSLQHGAVVAREYGIPCVSGINNVTTVIKDGDFIEVDGSNGTIKILETGDNLV